MPNEILIKSGTPIVWKNSGGDYALSFGGIAAADGQQGAKADLGATRANRYLIRLTVDPNVPPTAGLSVDVYWAGSPNATEASENPGGVTGSDAAYTDTDLLKQLEFIGSLILDNTTSDQTQDVGILTPKHRYGSPVVYSNSDQAMNATEGNQQLVAYPVVDEIQ